jgi:arginyl-tRNA--protein-N-Asp/Glu arginylyltransferase
MDIFAVLFLINQLCMFANIHYPEKISAKQLDAYLANGWFRMGQSIFTTNFLRFNEQFYSAIWLRIALADFYLSKTQQKLKKLNAKFNVVVDRASITPEKEQLFAKYRASISFDASPSLPYLLYNESNKDIFDSYNVCVYEEEKLIAVGYFDLGQTTSMGISCFYDPDYKKYSLGKYLMLLKIEYAIEQGLTYFYPGYFAPGYPLFDYKLDLAKAGLSFLDVVSNEWFDIAYFDSSQTPLVKMRQELNHLSTLLSNAGIDNSVWDYGYYDANLIPDLNGMGIFDFPVFLCCFNMLDSLMNPLVIYDPRDNNFHLILCRSLFRGDSSPNLEKKIYIANLLTIAKHYTATHSSEHLVNILLHSTKQSQKEQKS